MTGVQTSKGTSLNHKLSNIFMYNSEDLGSRQRRRGTDSEDLGSRQRFGVTAPPHKLSTDSEDLGTRQRRRVIQPTSQVKYRLRRPWVQTARRRVTAPPHKL
ncbi:Hypothetical predicted protein, partial [Mytilus galloprovincialis]